MMAELLQTGKDFCVENAFRICYYEHGMTPKINMPESAEKTGINKQEVDNNEKICM